MKIPNGDTCTMATLNMLFARGGVGVCLDRINKIDRIVGVRVESWSSRKELRTIPLSNYFLQPPLNLVNLVNPVEKET